MALQTSGPISLNDIHIEAGGTTGTNCSINDADIRALISKAASTTMGFDEWYGASAGPVSFSFNATVGNSGGYPPYSRYGFNTPNASGAFGVAFGTPTSAVTIAPNIECCGVVKQNYPAAGTPATYIYFNTGGSLIDPTSDPAYANMYYTVSSGGYTTGNIPVGTAAVAARQSTVFSSAVSRGTFTGGAYIVNYYLTQYDNLWPNSQPSSANNTAWVVTLYW